MTPLDKITELRHVMQKHGLAAYIQPVHDEFRSEYPPACNRRVEWLTGFAGSAGTVAVTANKAALFIDGRYTLQAEQETDAALYERHNISDLSPAEWLAAELAPGAKAGYDAALYTQDMRQRLLSVLGKKDIAAAPCPNLVDEVWAGRPAAPASTIFIHDSGYAGESSADKRRRIADKLSGAGADAAVLTMPDSVCWLLNIRARDVEQTPLLLANAIIAADGKVRLYADSARAGEDTIRHLGSGVSLHPPAALEQDLAALGKSESRVLCDPQSTPVWFTQQLADAGARIVEADDPCLLPKAMKNAVELQGIRNAHKRDGVAVSRLLCWLDAQEKSGTATTEQDLCDTLLALRAAHHMFLEPSFSTIAGSGPNGAIVHYRVSPQSNRTLNSGELFLLDSGGQYPDGTTDITRTVAFGTPSAEHKDRFTRVLKGHIALAMAQFPRGTAGSQLDVLARQYLWQDGLDYDHGTGHGVGHFLNVHEGPQRIGKRGGDAVLQPGMVISNEPGYYKTGAYGIRIENLVAVCELTPGEGGKSYLGFETLTCVPIDTRLVDVGMLSDAERAWLNGYHEWVYAELAELLNDVERDWLSESCRPV